MTERGNARGRGDDPVVPDEHVSSGAKPNLRGYDQNRGSLQGRDFAVALVMAGGILTIGYLYSQEIKEALRNEIMFSRTDQARSVGYALERIAILENPDSASSRKVGRTREQILD